MAMTRWQRPARTVAPAAPIITTTEAKAHLRVDFSEDDTLIGALITTATDYLDGWSGVMGRALITQTWTRKADGFPCSDMIRLPLPDVQSATVAYYDSDGDAQSFSSFYLVTDAEGSYLQLYDNATWPTTDTRPDAITVTMVCGYGDAATDVPGPVLSAALLLVGHLYENREAVGDDRLSEVPFGVGMLIAPYRAVSI